MANGTILLKIKLHSFIHSFIYSFIHGRIYATSYTCMERNYAKCFLHKSFIKLFTNFMGKIHAKVKKGRCLLIVFVIGYEYHQYMN